LKSGASTPAAEVRPPTLFQRIRADIERNILNGTWPPGYRIPYEHELMAQYGCSRMTVSKAISALTDLRLVVRKRRAGTFVARPHLQSVVLDIPDIQAEIASRGLPYGYCLLWRKRRAPYKSMPHEVELAGGQPLLALRCLHTANGQPFALEDRLISLAAVPEAASTDFSTIPPGSWLLGHVPWTEAQHRITAMNSDAECATLLGVANGAACLSLERQTWRNGESVTYVRQLFPGESYDLIARFAPSYA